MMKKKEKTKPKPAADKDTANVLHREGTGMGGVQLGAQGNEKPSKGDVKPSGKRKTSREVRDLG